MMRPKTKQHAADGWSEREVYLDEKQNPISFPPRGCERGFVHVMSLRWDSLMAVGIVSTVHPSTHL